MGQLVAAGLALAAVGFMAPSEAGPGQNFGQCVREGYQTPSQRDSIWSEYGPFNLRLGDDKPAGGPWSDIKSGGASRFSLGHVCPVIVDHGGGKG